MKKNPKKNVHSLRQKVDAIDSKILGLLNERAEASVEIGRIKLSEGQGIYAPHREKEVLDRPCKRTKQKKASGGSSSGGNSTR